MTAAIIVGFRDRGVDPLRQANLERVLTHYGGHFPVLVIGDGRSGDAQFNRHAAYNRGAAQTDADVLVYIEADILIDPAQIRHGIDFAAHRAGQIIPFSFQHKLSEVDSRLVRGYLKDPADCVPELTHHTAETFWNHGCATIINRTTLEMVGGWDEKFEGHGHDDTAMLIAFDRVTGYPPACIDGPAYHLYHLDFDPTLTRGAHITAADVDAQQRNLDRLNLYRRTTNPHQIRQLTAGGGGDWRHRA
jgi:hypothetical protein